MSLRTLIRTLSSLRLRNHIRILAGLHPAQLRARYPDLDVVGLSRGDIVIDAGANVGDFSEAVLAHQPWVRIHAFEPLPGAYRTLCERLHAFGDIEFQQIALGRTQGDRDFFVRAYDQASSFLPNGIVAKKGVCGIDFSTKETLRIPVTTLSDYLLDRGITRVRLFKLDVQGFELEVLAGAEPVLERIEWIYTEAQFEELYQEAPLANDIFSYLYQRGFELCRMMSVRADDEGNMMECDMLFRRI